MGFASTLPTFLFSANLLPWQPEVALKNQDRFIAVAFLNSVLHLIY